jgi:hypothetical protein
MNLTLDLTLDDFRSMMLLLEAQHGGTQWTLPSGARLVVQRGPDSDPTIHAAWVVSIPIDVDGTNRRHATIQAFRQAEGTIVLVEDRRRITSSGQSQLLDPDRAIGPLFHELCRELQHQIDLRAPAHAIPIPTQRGKNLETPFKVARARLIMQLKNTSQTVACGLAPVSPHTFREWFDDPDVLHEMERLRHDPSFLDEIEAI